MAVPVFPPAGGGGGGGGQSVTAPITGDGSSGNPLAETASSAGAAGSMSAANFSKLAAIYRPIDGTALTNASQTVQPFTDRVSQYVQAVAITVNRNKTLGINGAFTGMVVRIVRTDTSAFTLSVLNGGANSGTMFTFAASPTEAQGATFVYNGTDWTFVPGGFEYLTVS